MKLRALARATALAALMSGPGPFAAAHAATRSSRAPEIGRLHDALRAADGDRWTTFSADLKALREPLAVKLARWASYQQPGNPATFAEMTRFIERNPAWPNLALISVRAEEAISVATPQDEILSWFSRHAPRTTPGAIAYAKALQATGHHDEAVRLARRIWHHATFGRQQEEDFLKAFGTVLTREDYVRRLDNLLWTDRLTDAWQIRTQVDAGHRALAEARIALDREAQDVAWRLERVPESLRNDPGLIFDRLRFLRRRNKDDAAFAILLHLPPTLTHEKAWWTERAIMARRGLDQGRITDAYRVAAASGLRQGTQQYADAQWLAGWIALRFLHDGTVALGHFRDLFDHVVTPVSRARGAYWAGRAEEALGKVQDSRHWYEVAARYPTTFYGQLATARLAGNRLPHLDLPPAPDPNAAEIAAFERSELVRAARLLDRAGGRDPLKAFILKLQADATTPGQQRLVARLALSFRRPDLALLAGKRSDREGVLLVRASYPVLPVVARTQPDSGPDPALVLAVMRQESGFDDRAVSPVGAMGLMQLMPATAKRLAHQARLPFARHRLIDPAYNARIGQVYLSQLLDMFNGSYVLSLAAYNAGPARVRQWIQENGDPRDEHVDVVDWIEEIPYPETRNYVQRVLESVPVYRHLLKRTEVAFRLEPMRRNVPLP